MLVHVLANGSKGLRLELPCPRRLAALALQLLWHQLSIFLRLRRRLLRRLQLLCQGPFLGRLRLLQQPLRSHHLRLLRRRPVLRLVGVG